MSNPTKKEYAAAMEAKRIVDLIESLRNGRCSSVTITLTPDLLPWTRMAPSLIKVGDANFTGNTLVEALENAVKSPEVKP